MGTTFKKSVITSAVALACMGSASAFAAGAVQFCATGTSCAGITVTQFIWQQNSIIAQHAYNNSAGATVLPSILQGQGWLTQLNGPTPTSDDHFTYVFSIDLTAVKSGTGAGDFTGFVDSQATLPTAVTATNYFRMYHHTVTTATLANFNAGTGLTTGSLILEGAVYLDSNGAIPGTTGAGTNILISNTSESVIGPGSSTQAATQILTVSASGAVVLDINVLSSESGYFRTDISSLDLDITFDENNRVPFTGVQVPALVNGVTPDFGAIAGARWHNDFTCNGDLVDPLCDIISGAGSASATVMNALPEPGTVAMLGLGLLGLGAFGVRKRS